MAVFKCKMCGGNLEFTEGQSFGTCDSCGSTMTLPKGNDERIINLFNRATHYRQQNEFDKAMATYESILEEDNENGDAYWGRVLSKYGIEYVEDPKTHKRIPTCHRLQHESILSDLDYKAALKYALDYDAERLYKEEAEKISEIQKNILSVANNEDPYDIFICYKETDSSGKRTVDSVLAQDIYSQLTDAGYKVFFSRITLEDKLGKEYEPYIFAALNSAKVMLVVGTDKSHFDAVWVKNEWSRFLSMTKNDKNKIIIPCYRDMDAYDLPDELSIFQSQDMNKIGFMQDLLRGIKKIINTTSPQTTVVMGTPDLKAQTQSFIDRAFVLLRDSEWSKADELLEKALNIEHSNAKAYIGKLMIDTHANTEDELSDKAYDFDIFNSYKNALGFSEGKDKERLIQYRESALEKYRKMFDEVFVSIKSRNYNFANESLNKIIDIDPNNYRAYIGKLLIEAECTSEADLSNLEINLLIFPAYRKALEIADEDNKHKLENYNKNNLEMLKARREDSYRNCSKERIEYIKKTYRLYLLKLLMTFVGPIILASLLTSVLPDNMIVFLLFLMFFAMVPGFVYMIREERQFDNIRQQTIKAKLMVYLCDVTLDRQSKVSKAKMAKSTYNFLRTCEVKLTFRDRLKFGNNGNPIVAMITHLLHNEISSTYPNVTPAEINDIINNALAYNPEQ